MPKNFVFVVAAYMAIWIVLLVYLLSVGNRVTKLQQQINLLKDKKK